MAEAIAFKAEPREPGSKGAARALRRSGRVPGVIYGDKRPPILISVDPKQLNLELSTGGFFSTLYRVEVNGKSRQVLAREVQFHPVSDVPLHVDFLRVSAKEKVTVEVPVTFINEEESPGIKRGGVLNIVRHEIEVECLPSQIPHEIIADLTGLEINDGVHISMITLPEGVESTIRDRDFTIASVAAPSAVKAEAAEEAEAAELAAEALEGEEAEGEEGEEEEGEAESDD